MRFKPYSFKLGAHAQKAVLIHTLKLKTHELQKQSVIIILYSVGTLDSVHLSAHKHRSRPAKTLKYTKCNVYIRSYCFFKRHTACGF